MNNFCQLFYLIRLYLDPFGQVLAALLGEYEYTSNFQKNELWITKLIFVLFLMEMSVVMMNLVLGLAVSDIEQLQKDSEVQRMVQKTYTVMFIDNFLMAMSRIPGMGR